MAVEKLTFEMNAVGNAVPEMKKVQSQLGSLDKTMMRTTRNYANQTKEIARTRRGMKKLSYGMGQVGLQVQDVAVQASMGTDALRIFSMQGPQILSIFGPLGMVAGALGGVGAGILMASGGLDRFKGAFEAIAPVFDNFLDKMSVLMQQFTPLVSFVGGLVTGAFRMLGNVVDFVSDNIAALTVVAGTFVTLKLAGIAFRAAQSFVALAKAISATKILMGALNAVTRRNPILFIAIAAGVAADRLGLITEAMEKLREEFPQFFDAISDAGDATNKLILESFDALNAALRTPLHIEIGDDATPKLKQIQSETEKLAKIVADRMQAASDAITNGFEKAFMSMIDGTTKAKDAFRIMASDIIKELYRIFVVKRITGFIADVFGLMTGSPVGQVSMGGVKAIGGPVQRGNPYVVGERGPELFVPSRTGSIVPNDKMTNGGAVVVNQTINVSTGVQQTVRTEIKSLMPQIAESAKAAVADAKRRGGSYGRAFA